MRGPRESQVLGAKPRPALEVIGRGVVEEEVVHGAVQHGLVAAGWRIAAANEQLC
jgi:hypothetical protein